MRLGFKTIVAAVVLTVILIMIASGAALAAPPWPDAPNSWWVSSYGVTDTDVGTVADGYPDGLFRPANSVTRGQATKMVVNGLGVDPLDPLAPTFLDVPKGHTFFTFIEGAFEADLVTGYPVTGGLEFRPNSNMTRQQANTILGRYLSDTEILVTGVIHGTGGLTYASLELWYLAQGGFYLGGFLDAPQVAAVHRPTTAYLVYHGVVQGSNGRLNPLATLNRAQAAAMVLRVADEAAEITTPPPAPTDLIVTPNSPGRDTTPQISGTALPSRPIAVYDTFGGATAKLTETTTNAAGIFYADLAVPLVDGTHVFTAKVKNALGVVSSASEPVEYVLDTVAPTGTTTAPSVPAGQIDAAVNTDQPVFTVAAADERSGVESVAFEYATAAEPTTWIPISMDEDGAPYAAVWGATSLADGQYLLRAIVTDAAGNTTILSSVPVTVDTTPPTAEIAPGSLEPQASTGGVIFYTHDRKPLFGGLAADAVGTGALAGAVASGVVRIDFLHADSSPEPDAWEDFSLISSDLGSSGFAAYNATGVPVAGMLEGDYYWAVRATDRAGNVSLLLMGSPADLDPDATQRVVVDYTAPVVSVTAPAQGASLTEGTIVDVAWTLADTSPPESVFFQYSLDNGATWLPDTAIEVPFTAGAPGTYSWTVPEVDVDETECLVRIVAIDMAGFALGLTDSTEGHYTAQPSGVFTILND